MYLYHTHIKNLGRDRYKTSNTLLLDFQRISILLPLETIMFRRGFQFVSRCRRPVGKQRGLRLQGFI